MGTNKTTKCKKCGAEITAIAVMCPSCGTKNKKPIYKKVWVWVVAVFVAIAAIGSAGESTPTDTVPVSSFVSVVFSEETSVPSSSLEEVVSAIPSSEIVSSEPAPSKMSSAASSTASSAASSAALSAVSSVVSSNEKEEMVWVPTSGKKYHSNPDCSGMKNPKQIPLSEAFSRNIPPCKNCY